MSETLTPPTSPGNGHAPGLEHERQRLISILQHRPAPSGSPQAALQRRYCRALLEVAQLGSRPPAGAGKRLRSRIARMAEGLAEAQGIAAQMKAADRM